MPDMTLTEAAKWAGVTRPTMFKALKSGRLSGRKDAAGEWRIDPAELARAYAPRISGNVTGNGGLSTSDLAEALAAKEREIALLREALDDARGQRDQAMALAEAQTRLLGRQQQVSAAAPETSPLAPAVGGWRARLGRLIAG